MNAPISIYVHLPWCVRKCPYCDFNSHARPECMPETEYVAALLADLECDLDLAAGRRCPAFFWAAARRRCSAWTPSRRCSSGLATRLPFLPDAEITMEANPGTIEHGRFAGYARAGINRVSLGAQSFNAASLAVLGRIHGPEEIGAAARELASAGLHNFNLDLMYALPQQTREGALADLEAAHRARSRAPVALPADARAGHRLLHRPPPLPDDDAAFEMQLDCHARLRPAGFAQYEVSAYARPGRQCRHNLNYWRFGDYLGIGAGAHGKATVAGQVVRTEKPRSPREYLRGAGRQAASGASSPAGELPFEYMLNVLRLAEGFTLADFERATGLPAASIDRTLAAQATRGLMRGARWPVPAHLDRIPLPERPDRGVPARGKSPPQAGRVVHSAFPLRVR